MRALVFILLISLIPISVLYGMDDSDKPPQVWTLEIVGNKTFTDFVLKNHMATDAFSFWEKTHFWDREGHVLNKTVIQKDVVRLQKFYHRRGFPSVSVDYKIIKMEGQKRKIVFTIDEGRPVTIERIEYIFSPVTSRRRIQQHEAFVDVRTNSAFKLGKRFEPAKKYQVINAYKRVLKRMGYAYAQVEVEATVDTSAYEANIRIGINSGPLTKIEGITVKGERALTSQDVIRETGLYIGELYDIKEIQEAQRQLYDHPLVNFVNIHIPAQRHDSTLTLAIHIKEKKLRTVELSAGFSTEEYLRGRVSWIHRNAFNQAHRFSVTAKASFIDQFFGMNYLFPYAFNTSSSFLIAPFAQHLLRPGYELYRWGVTNSLIYRYNRDFTASLSYQFTQNDEVSRQNQINLPDSAKMYDLSSWQLSALYSKGLRLRNRGWVIRPSLQISGLSGLADFQFQKLSIDVRRYIPITKSTTLALRVQAAKIYSAKEDSLPRSVRVYLGGSNSVRGWARHELGPKIAIYQNENNERVAPFMPEAEFEKYIPIGGRSSFAFNIEIRQDINALIKGLGIVLFLDGGQVWRHEPDISKRPLQFGIGGGLRYRSPVGPIRLDVGYKLNPSDADLKIINGVNKGTMWDRFAIYLSIGQAF